jgi:glucodextranase-like protein
MLERMSCQYYGPRSRTTRTMIRIVPILYLPRRLRRSFAPSSCSACRSRLVLGPTRPIGFGSEPESAARNAIASLHQGFPTARDDYIAGWQGWIKTHASPKKPAAGAGDLSRGGADRRRHDRVLAHGAASRRSVAGYLRETADVWYSCIAGKLDFSKMNPYLAQPTENSTEPQAMEW